jgi:BlaI family transcriptional regulator, penicillinase repressor
MSDLGDTMSKRVPSERELDLLKVMWQLGEAKVRDIHDALCPNGECAFTTVQTLVRIMLQKGFVTRRSEGRTDYFTPVYTLEDATSRFVDKLFDGAVDRFVLSMLSAEDVSADEMRKLEQMIAKARRVKEKQDREEQ